MHFVALLNRCSPDQNMWCFLLCFLFSLVLTLSNEASNGGKIFQERDHLLPGFNVRDLEVAREYTSQSPECPEAVEKVTHTFDHLDMVLHSYQVHLEKKSGKITDSLLNVFVKEKQELKTGEGKGLEYWPELNCMEQDDCRLIEHLREFSFNHLLWWPLQ